MRMNFLPSKIPSELPHVNRFCGNPSFPFKVQPKFLNVIRSVEGCDPDQTVFNYQEIVELFSKYILSNRHEIFDPRNLKVALVENSLLGAAFNVSSFHRCQARFDKFLSFLHFQSASRFLLDKQLVCLSLAHEAAWTITSWLSGMEAVDTLDIPREVKHLLLRMMENSSD
jgi:hypothetical protein